MHILYCDVVDGTAVQTHAPRAILFGHKKDMNGTRIEALPDVAFLKKVTNLLLKFLGLHRIGTVSWSVWQRRSWNKVYLMFNASYWWQSFRILIWKYIRILLQNI